MKKKIVRLFTPPYQPPLILDEDVECETDIIKIIELVSSQTGISPDKVKLLINKYNKEYQDSYKKVDLEDYLFYEIYKLGRKDTGVCDNMK